MMRASFSDSPNVPEKDEYKNLFQIIIIRLCNISTANIEGIDNITNYLQVVIVIVIVYCPVSRLHCVV